MMNAQSIDLSIVIVTWNARRFVQECLDSLRSSLEDRGMEVVIVDNASSDGTPELVERDFPRARLIRNSANLGFAKANNIGIAASTGRYVCLINSDVIVPGECLPRMFAHMEANPSIGMLGPQMLCPNGLVGRSYMRFPSVWRGLCDALGLHRVFRQSKYFSGIEMTDFDNSRTAEVDVLNGWFLMARKSALKEVGMLDEQFFMYGEDIDWSYRFHLAGWKRVYFSGARAFHYGGASSAAAPTRFYIEMQRANLQLCAKHFGARGRLACLAIACLHDLVRMIGYGFLMIAWRPKRSRSVFLAKRSIACIRWLASQGRATGEKAL